ncbi:magnesium transporter MgtE N-terminal domain-containing protein [Streptomyces rugosispiralis]|uniref:CBS domain-containing protein n=1 Tax=Streptomyces rugosispiralis TaxID=2967341 RepID=A0ABT1VCC0_9ACTN|nr:CBS domain-containing protein [Streptomyces rugosispiralis]MCQ8195048.1 CBS domain-containing protein [Streptomyces rugosispiralis]
MERVAYLAQLLRRPVVGGDGEVVGRLADVIVRLRGREYPLVTGLVARVGGREVFLPAEQVAVLDAEKIALTSPRVDLRHFERREGEVLLRADVLGHRVIDVADAELVRAYDIELEQRPEGWVLTCLDTRRPPRWWRGLAGRAAGPDWRDWKSFEPLIGHARSARVRGPFARLGRLKPADLADLLEDASRTESHEILQTVHADPELEADVFEELEPDSQTRLLRERSDSEIAQVITRMRADDAADAINDLPQRRRQPVLDALPAGQRTKVLTLMGFNPSSAGGLMALDVLTMAGGSTVAEALRAAGEARTLQPEALTSVYLVGEEQRLLGVVTLVELLQADPAARLEDVADRDPVRAGPDTDVEDVALLMTDYNLLTVAVADGEGRILGVITVDDVLDMVIPQDWRRREPAPHPAHRVERPGPGDAPHEVPPGS